MVGFVPFKTAANALENINAVSEGIVTQDLQQFLQTCLPKSGKGGKTVLGTYLLLCIPTDSDHDHIYLGILRALGRTGNSMYRHVIYYCYMYNK